MTWSVTERFSKLFLNYPAESRVVNWPLKCIVPSDWIGKIGDCKVEIGHIGVNHNEGRCISFYMFRLLTCAGDKSDGGLIKVGIEDDNLSIRHMSCINHQHTVVLQAEAIRRGALYPFELKKQAIRTGDV